MGKKADVVCKMLYILSYFIRCSEVLENTLQCPQEFSEEKVVPGDMSPINESDPSRRTSQESVGNNSADYTDNLEVAAEAQESPPLSRNQDSAAYLFSTHDHGDHEDSPTGSSCQAASERTVVCPSVSSTRTESVAAIEDSRSADSSAMVKSDSTVTSSQSDKTLSPTTSCLQVELPAADTTNSTGSEEVPVTHSAEEIDHIGPSNTDEFAANYTTGTCKLSHKSPEDVVAKVDEEKHVFRDIQYQSVTSHDCASLEGIIYCGQKYGSEEENIDPADTHDSGFFAETTESENGPSLQGDQLSDAASFGEGSKSGKVYPKIIECSFTRNNSMFDEYFTDGNTTPSDLPSLGQLRVGKVVEYDRYKRLASIEGSNSVMDEYIDVPLPDFGESIREENCSERISPKEGYFMEESQSAWMMPAGVAKEQVEHALQLMQQSSREEMLSSEELTTSGDSQSLRETGWKTPRPNSLSLSSCSKPFHRQNSHASKTPTSSKRYLAHNLSCSLCADLFC